MKVLQIQKQCLDTSKILLTRMQLKTKLVGACFRETLKVFDVNVIAPVMVHFFIQKGHFFFFVSPCKQGYSLEVPA